MPLLYLVLSLFNFRYGVISDGYGLVIVLEMSCLFLIFPIKSLLKFFFFPPRFRIVLPYSTPPSPLQHFMLSLPIECIVVNYIAIWSQKLFVCWFLVCLYPSVFNCLCFPNVFFFSVYHPCCCLFVWLFTCTVCFFLFCFCFFNFLPSTVCFVSYLFVLTLFILIPSSLFFNAPVAFLLIVCILYFPPLSFLPSQILVVCLFVYPLLLFVYVVWGE